jgi:hypothetical protein
VHGGLPAAQLASVHDVVVDQQTRVAQLQGGGGADNLLTVVAAGATPAPVAQLRSHPLAAAEDERGQQTVCGLDARVGNRSAPGFQEPAQTLVNA